jgi:hypothetical protein
VRRESTPAPRDRREQGIDAAADRCILDDDDVALLQVALGRGRKRQRAQGLDQLRSNTARLEVAARAAAGELLPGLGAGLRPVLARDLGQRRAEPVRQRVAHLLHGIVH